MNALDVVLVLLLALAALSGYRRGFALQVFSFGGLLVGLAAGALVAPAVAGIAGSPAGQAGLAATTLLVLAALGDGAGWLIGLRVRARARGTRFGSADAAGGSAVAVVASLLAIWFLALNLVNGPFPGVAREIRGSAVVRTLDGALPAPPSLLGQAQRFFNRFGFPDVFTGLPPLPTTPVEPPTAAEEAAAFRAAVGSTVQIVGEACGHVQEGSGFVAEPGYVVTNAHVLAGVDAPFVRTTDGGNRPGTTVLFDPALDLAVLFVQDVPGEPLPFTTVDVEREDAGAILGFPGGGPLDSRPAAVLRPFPATGRDIYGSAEIERSVLELQAVVRPGNSGGPFVLADGTVAGVVFAASSTDGRVGYAIDARDVAPRVTEAVGRRGEVGTGSCLR